MRICGIAKSQGCKTLKIGGIENHIHILYPRVPSIDFTHGYNIPPSARAKNNGKVENRNLNGVG